MQGDDIDMVIHFAAPRHAPIAVALLAFSMLAAARAARSGLVAEIGATAVTA